MATTVTTTYKTQATSGKGQILAKGAGKQVTVDYDPAVSPAVNHGTAAAALYRRLGIVRAQDASAEDLGSGKFRFKIF